MSRTTICRIIAKIALMVIANTWDTFEEMYQKRDAKVEKLLTAAWTSMTTSTSLQAIKDFRSLSIPVEIGEDNTQQKDEMIGD